MCDKDFSSAPFKLGIHLANHFFKYVVHNIHKIFIIHHFYYS